VDLCFRAQSVSMAKPSSRQAVSERNRFDGMCQFGFRAVRVFRGEQVADAMARRQKLRVASWQIGRVRLGVKHSRNESSGREMPPARLSLQLGRVRVMFGVQTLLDAGRIEVQNLEILSWQGRPNGVRRGRQPHGHPQGEAQSVNLAPALGPVQPQFTSSETPSAGAMDAYARSACEQWIDGTILVADGSGRVPVGALHHSRFRHSRRTTGGSRDAPPSSCGDPRAGVPLDGPSRAARVPSDLMNRIKPACRTFDLQRKLRRSRTACLSADSGS